MFFYRSCGCLLKIEAHFLHVRLAAAHNCLVLHCPAKKNNNSISCFTESAPKQCYVYVQLRKPPICQVMLLQSDQVCRGRRSGWMDQQKKKHDHNHSFIALSLVFHTVWSRSLFYTWCNFVSSLTNDDNHGSKAWNLYSNPIHHIFH